MSGSFRLGCYRNRTNPVLAVKMVLKEFQIMNNAPSSKIFTKLFTPLLVVFALVIAVLLLYVPSAIRENTIDAAIPAAVSTVQQYKTIRGYYTKNVIKKVKSASELKPHFDHKNEADRIPLPATFIHELSEQFSSEGILSLKLYSPYPFPNRNNRQLDDFGQTAWQAMQKSSSEVYSQVDEINGKQVVRVAVADTMAVEACVVCHNHHPDTPKNDWKLGDVRGVLEVQVPIDAQLAASQILNTKIVLLVIGALAITVLVIMYLFKNLISSRLKKISLAMDDIAHGEGNLSQRLPISQNDEIGNITRSFNTFVEQLESTINMIRSEVSQLVGTSGDLQGITQQFKQGAAEQLNQTDLVATAISEMSATNQEVASVTTRTSTQAGETEKMTRDGMAIVDKNQHSVQSLSEQIQQTSNVVSKLEEDSQNIGSVLDVIRSIAEQTNLLALNAAIEAARAGEQGRGFAVVADEVRTLASRTQASTEEIQTMIEHLQQGAKSAVSSIKDGSTLLDTNLELAQQTHEVMRAINDSIAELKSLNYQIATSSEQQSSVSEEVNANTINIVNISTSTTEKSESLTTMAEEINSAITTINSQLNRFH